MESLPVSLLIYRLKACHEDERVKKWWVEETDMNNKQRCRCYTTAYDEVIWWCHEKVEWDADRVKEREKPRKSSLYVGDNEGIVTKPEGQHIWTLCMQITFFFFHSFFFFRLFFSIPSIVPILLRAIIMIKHACLVTEQRKEWHGNCRHLWEGHRTRHKVKLTMMPTCKHVELPPNKCRRIWWPPGKMTVKSIITRSMARKEKVYWSDYFTLRSHSACLHQPDGRGLGMGKWKPS